MDSSKKGTTSKEPQKQPSKISTRKSIRFLSMVSQTNSDLQVLEEEVSEEIDIDERVMRSSTGRHLKLEWPCSVFIENSRIFDLLQTHFPHELPHDTDWPEFDTMISGECIQYVGELIGCENHEENLASFWLLDTLCEVVRQGQLKAVSNENLNVICIWFAHLLKTISGVMQVHFKITPRESLMDSVTFKTFLINRENGSILISGSNKFVSVYQGMAKLQFELLFGQINTCGFVNICRNLVYAPSREDFFISVNEMLFEAEADYLETGKIIYPKDIMKRLETKKNEIKDVMNEGRTSLPELQPVADEINIISESNETLTDTQDSQEQLKNLSNGKDSAPVDQAEISEECAKLNDFAFLTEQIFRIFGNCFKFEVIKTVFSDPPEIQPIVIVVNMNFPKDLGQSQRHIQEINTKKREPSVKIKPGKPAPGTAKASKKKGKAEKEHINIALENFKSELQHIDWEREDEKEKERTKDFYVKPLEDSVNKEFFERLFPKHESELAQLQKVKEKPEIKGKPKKK